MTHYKSGCSEHQHPHSVKTLDQAGMLIFAGPKVGASKGIDVVVEHYCRRTGVECVPYVPPCHPCAGSLMPVPYSRIQQVKAQVMGSAFRLQRPVTSPLADQYLGALWCMIQDASLVLVFGYLDTMAVHVNGHSGWAVDMAKIMHKPLYVFDLRHEEWCWWNARDKQFQDQHHMSHRWIQPPILQDKTAIVGPRECTPPGFMIEIQRLFSCK